MKTLATCVGKSSVRGVAVIDFSDHPHVRGEKHATMGFTHTHHGSSPRAWGKVPPTLPIISLMRISPTCVGKSAGQQQSQAATPDHPHVRGEKSDQVAAKCSGLGSSPRAWGKASPVQFPLSAERIIPTCVGKSTSFALFFILIPDHPHVRGEKFERRTKERTANGSSPRAWGKGCPI